MNERIARLVKVMIEYDRGDNLRIHHLLKVHDLAVTIATLEHLDEYTSGILEAAAVVHDIGIHLSEKKYGSSSGKYQEMEGPAEARALLHRTGGFSEEEIDRVCFLVGHHHTYSHIEGMDYQILVEADFLVNIYEDGVDGAAVDNIRKRIFRTRTGLQLLDAMYGLIPQKYHLMNGEGGAFC